MIEFDSEPLSGTGSPFHARINVGGMCTVSGGFEMEFPYSLLDSALKTVYADSEWKILGACRTSPKNLGTFMQEQRICPAYHSPQFASAIAPIMVRLNLVEARPFRSKREGIWLRRKI